MGIKTTPFDMAEYLDSPEAVEAYLEEAFRTNDTALIAVAVGHVARAKGMTSVSNETGLSRESLYRSLSETGNPELGTILKVMSAVGFSLRPKTQPSGTALVD
jgi:probable addiction module antidote protein